MFTIQNETISVVIRPKGAELDSIYHKAFQLEYLWSGDPAFWAKKSPVLFPIVGTLKNDRYDFEGKAYHMGRHGFARDAVFEVSEQSGDAITLFMKSSDHTLGLFPFPFVFSIRYALEQHRLHVAYTVKNTGTGTMYFSVGGHPAFKVPLEANAGYEDYHLEFGAMENAGRWPISGEGLIEDAPEPLLDNTNILPLTKELFSSDALVFKSLASNTLRLKSSKAAHGLEMDFTGFPYLGIWAAKDADFVCIEPWCGIADGVNASGQLTEKEGIHKLEEGMVFTRTYTLTFF